MELAERYEHVYAAVGWHPEEWESWTGESIPLLRQLGEWGFFVQALRGAALGKLGKLLPDDFFLLLPLSGQSGCWLQLLLRLLLQKEFLLRKPVPILVVEKPLVSA